jgi:hypothetical protein
MFQSRQRIAQPNLDLQLLLDQSGQSGPFILAFRQESTWKTPESR